MATRRERLLLDVDALTERVETNRSIRDQLIKRYDGVISFGVSPTLEEILVTLRQKANQLDEAAREAVEWETEEGTSQ